MAHRIRTGRLAAFAAILLAAGLPATARDITVAGLTFSDAEGGFTLVSATGSGTLADPIVIVEEMTDLLGGTLIVTGMSRIANLVGSQHSSAFALTKVVVNRTDEPWPAFDIELQEVQGTPSDRNDGLSFGQASDAGKPFRSDVFPNLVSVEEPLDRLTFADATVQPGERVSFHMVVSDMTPLDRIYLVQRRLPAVARLPQRLELAIRLCESCGGP